MLTLIRHGETEANVERRKTGQIETPLTENGISQAKSVAEDHNGYEYDYVFTSPLSRCVDTTQYAIGQRHPQDTWIRVEELMERSGGVLEGMLYSDMRKTMPPRQYKLWQRDYFEAPPMGESMADVHDRVIPWFKENVLPLVNNGSNVWICTHDIVMKILIGYIKGLNEVEIPKLKIGNCVPYVLYGTFTNKNNE